MSKTIFTRTGYWADGTVYVRDVNGEREIPLRLDEGVNHSPTGFGWGYGGSGPAQLAYCLLREAGLSRAEAKRWYQGFKFKIVAALDPQAGWELTDEDILTGLAAVQVGERAAN
jgi:hypothetical protein